MNAKNALNKSLRLILLITLLWVTQGSFGQQSISSIRLNQVGFFPDSKKVAILTDNVNSKNFYVVSEKSKDTIYKGELSQQIQSEYSSLVTKIADFSKFKKEGIYYLFVPGAGNSYPFFIDNNVFDNVSKLVTKAFYYQRSGVDLPEKYAGKWHRALGYPDTAVLIHPSAASKDRPSGFVISSPKGWFDAGDYNKYIINSGITVATLLSAYEDYPNYYKDLNLNIPESGNALPDILDETLYNIDWMLTMQDPNDGGVYVKCTDADFNAMILPELATRTRYVVQKSTAAALDFAADMAYASRIFKPFEKELPGFSVKCLTAARSAWNWAIKHPDIYYDQTILNKSFDPDITTGEYGDSNLNDEWLWAATELLITTKDKQYTKIFNERINDAIDIPGWSEVGMLAYYAILKNQDATLFTNRILDKVRSSTVAMADKLLENGNIAFATVMGQSKEDYIWGSNSVAANQGILLLKVYNIRHDKKYLDGALANLDYLLGRNATGYCFVTGAGTKSPIHPHHRISEGDAVTEPVPGLLVGGPNYGMQDKSFYPHTAPEAAYTDITASYASNEIAINWNAPMVYLINAINYHY
ncbi:MAG: glycoside hydrolase family 9 protein [Flavobacterium sp.]|nr:glycoside hydrolase family 9 protein [Flavobacterium sp.]